MSIHRKQWVNPHGRPALPLGIYRVLSWEPGDIAELSREELDDEFLDMKIALYEFYPVLRHRLSHFKIEIKPGTTLSIMLSLEVIK